MDSDNDYLQSKLPKLRRTAWVLLERAAAPRITLKQAYNDSSVNFVLCFAVLDGKRLTLSEVQGGVQMGTTLKDLEVTEEIEIAKFSSWVRDNKYYISVTGPQGESLRFITKNQADLTMESSEVDYLNWQRMLAASLNIHLLEQKRYLLKRDALPRESWQRLGSGAFGQVYKAMLNSVTPVAIKQVCIADLMTPEEPDEKLHVDFINEALISCTIQGPCLLHFYGIFWDPPKDKDSTVLDYYMVSELCEGGDLRSLLYSVDERGNMHESLDRLSEKVLSQLLRELFSGLVYMHQNNVVHRDLKPDNIVLIRPIDQIDQVNSGILKIVDYGHSRTLPDATKMTGGVLTANDRGTELYRAPETMTSKSRSAQYSTKVDIFSTGVICWEMWHRELPFAALRHKHVIKVEQLIRDGVRPVIDDDCPPGLASLIRWCWASDPDTRPTAAMALKHVMKPALFDLMMLEDSNLSVFSAVVSGYWTRDDRLRARILKVLHAIALGSNLALGQAVVDIARNLVAILKDNLHSADLALVPLEAIACALSKSGNLALAFKTVLAESGAADCVAALIEKRCEHSRVNWLVLVLANELAEREPGYEGWSKVLEPVVELMKSNSMDAHIQTACVRFLACVCSHKMHQAATLNSDAVKYVVLAIEQHPHCAELHAPAAFFLRYAPQKLETHMLVRRSITLFVQCMEQRPGNVEQQGLWVQLMHHLSENPLGGLEVVKAGAIQIVMKTLMMHSNHLTYSILAVRMLRQIAGEPSHAILIAENGAPYTMLTLMKLHNDKSDLQISCIGVLANLAEVTSIHKLIVSCGAVPEVVERMKNKDWHSKEPALYEGARFICYICRNETHINTVANSDGIQVIVEMLNACLENHWQRPMEYCIEAIYHLAQMHAHRKTVIDNCGIEAIVTTTAKHSDVSSIQKWCLNAFCFFSLDGELRNIIAKMDGISVLLQTLMQPCDERIVEQAVSALQHFVFDPATRKMCPIPDVISVVSRVLRRNCSSLPIMESTVRMLSTIVYHKDCYGLFEQHNIKDTLQSIMDSYPNNTVIRHHGTQTLSAAYRAQHSDFKEVTTRSSVFKVILVGCTNVGKTCIVLRASRNEFSSTVKATLGVHIDFAELDFPSRKVTIQLYDTAGQEQYRALTRNFYRGAHAALLVYDTTRMDSFEELKNWHEEVTNNAPSDVIFAVVGSKCDLEADRVVESRRAEKFAKAIGANHFLVSAVANIGISKVFRTVCEQLTEKWPSGVPNTDERKFHVTNDGASENQCANCL
eukprot:m.172598 g.172598  ORF g.172598 m.172598 type:complete len:1267 (-) comp15375_c1_seq4:3904-7704(-)